MRVAYIGIKGLPARGGAERVVEAIATRMLAHGVSPTVYCDQRYTPPTTTIEGVRLVRLSALTGKHSRAASLDLFAAVHAILVGDYDLVHLHHVEASFVLPLLRLKYPVVSTSHGTAYRQAKWGSVAKRLIRALDLPFAKLSTQVTFVSTREAQDFERRWRRRGEYIPNGVDSRRTPDVQGAKDILNGCGLQMGRYFLFVAGRIYPTKGAHLAINAVNQLSADVPLLVVGDDGQVPAYSRQLREMAGGRVRFLPLVENPEVLFGLMAASICLIFPSMVEAMSMVLLEAASLGTPVVCSDIPENQEVMRDDATYFENGKAASLTAQLEWALAHRAEVSQMSSRARRRILAEYSWGSIAAQYVQLYRQVLNDHG